MKKTILSILIVTLCLLFQTQTGFAQSAGGGEILNGKAKTLVKPDYPETAKKSRVGGEVKVNVTVDEQGNVIKADAVSGEMLLRDAALAAARESKFSLNMVNGKLIKMSGYLVFNFVASDSENLDVFNAYLNRDKVDFWGSFTKLKNTSKESQNDDKKLDGNACLVVIFQDLDTTTYKFKLVDAQTLNATIKACDESIKIDSSKPFKFYNRGLARYYLIRGDKIPLGKTLQEASTVSAEDLRQSLTDLKAFIDWKSNTDL